MPYQPTAGLKTIMSRSSESREFHLLHCADRASGRRRLLPGLDLLFEDQMQHKTPNLPSPSAEKPQKHWVFQCRPKDTGSYARAASPYYRCVPRGRRGVGGRGDIIPPGRSARASPRENGFLLPKILGDRRRTTSMRACKRSNAIPSPRPVARSIRLGAGDIPPGTGNPLPVTWDAGMGIVAA